MVTKGTLKEKIAKKSGIKKTNESEEKASGSEKVIGSEKASGRKESESKVGAAAKEGKTSMVELQENIINELKECLPAMLKAQIKKFSMNDTVNIDNKFVDNKFVDNKSPKMVHNLVLKPSDTSINSYTPESWSEVVRKQLPQQLGSLPVEKSLLTSKGLGYLAFPNKEIRDKAAESLKSKYVVEVEDKNKKSVYPKVKISGINKEDYNKDNITELRKEILQKNAGLRELVENSKKVFEILFINDNKEQKYSFVVAKVDPLVKDYMIKNGNKVYVGLSACRVSDRVHLLQCYTCQQFGHKVGSDRCPLKGKDTHVCLYCSDNHMSRDCPVKKKKEVNNYKCANCCNSPNPRTKAGAIGHATTSHDCPVFQRELKNMLNRTMGMSSSSELSKNAIVT